MYKIHLRITIGIDLLQKMGWKEGQGIGPRVKRKPRKQKPGTFPLMCLFLVKEYSDGFNLLKQWILNILAPGLTL